MSFTVIPDNWFEIEIGDIADVIAGGTPKANDPSNFSEPGTGTAWLTPADLSGYKHKYISHGARDLSKKGYESSSAKLMPANSVLFSSRAPIGYIAISKNEISTNQGFKSFVFTEHVIPSYAYYFLKSIRDLAESRGTGTTFKELSGVNAKKLPFILAPLAEQKQIAARLDALLAQVDILKTRLDAIPTILKRFRQSVLAAAVSGKLTEGWRDIKKENSWGIVKLSKISDFQNGYAFKSEWFENTGEYQVIKLANVKDAFLKLEASPTFLKMENANGFISFMANVNDILISMTGTRFKKDYGYACLVPDGVKVLINQRVGRIIPYENRIIAKYLLLYLRSERFRDQFFEGETGGVNQGNVGSNHIKNCNIELPSLVEQTEIVCRVDQLFAFADLIEQRVVEAKKHVDYLAQSILAKAFSGDLTTDWRTQNQDLISGENSTQVLLEQIKLERDRLTKEGKTKSKKATRKIGNTMIPKQIVPIIDALTAAKKPLKAQELLAQAGYPNDADTDQLEAFFLDIREQLKLGTISRARQGDDDIFELVK